MNELEELKKELKELKNKFCGCGNCLFKNQICSSILNENLSYCDKYKLEKEENETLDTYNE